MSDLFSIKNAEIVCVLDNIVKGYLIGKNGPIIAAIQFNNINQQKFELSGDSIIYLQGKRPIQKGDHLKVSIININNNLGERRIMTMCKLLDIADKAAMQQYEDEQRLITDLDATILESDDKIFI